MNSNLIWGDANEEAGLRVLRIDLEAEIKEKQGGPMSAVVYLGWGVGSWKRKVRLLVAE